MNTIIPSNDSNNILTEHVALRLTGLNFALEGGTGATTVPDGAFTPWIDFRNWTELKLIIETNYNPGVITCEDIKIQYCLDPSSGIIIQVGDLLNTDEGADPTRPHEAEKIWESPIPPYIRFIFVASSTYTTNWYINISGRKKIRKENFKLLTVPAYTDVATASVFEINI